MRAWWTRRRQRRQAEGFHAEISSRPTSWGFAELRAVERLARVYGAEHDTEYEGFAYEAYGVKVVYPACMGPLRIHIDGSFECHGAGCPGVLAIFHPFNAVKPCDRGNTPMRHPCVRCAYPPDSPADIADRCTGVLTFHEDGVYICGTGPGCRGIDSVHAAVVSCGWQEPCLRCGPSFRRPPVLPTNAD